MSLNKKYIRFKKIIILFCDTYAVRIKDKGKLIQLIVINIWYKTNMLNFSVY